MYLHYFNSSSTKQPTTRYIRKDIALLLCSSTSVNILMITCRAQLVSLCRACVGSNVHYCEVISKRILIIFAPEEAEIFKDYLFILA
jgi:hypothetical protein